jgi:hypothetical protein
MSITPITPVYEECALWPVDPACLTDDWNALDPPIQARALALASATLRRLSGYRVTNCPITVRPCKRSCAEGCGYPLVDYYEYGGWTPHIGINGYWVNTCDHRGDCSCGPTCEIPLPGPVGRLDEVLVGAVDITADCRISGQGIMYVGTAPCPFPICQNLSAAPGEDGAFSVTYVNGYPPDALAAYAVGILAMEYAKACTGSKGCKLPVGTTSVVRQGVSIEIATGSFPGGVTGIREVDGWIALWRPEGSPKRAPAVWSPDRVAPRIQR